MQETERVERRREMSERGSMEEALREAQTRFRTLVEQLPAVTYVEELRDDGKSLRYMSPQYQALLGYSPEEGTSHPEHWLEIIHPEDRERVLAEDAHTDETFEPFKAEYRVFAKDGRVLWMRDEAVVVRDEAGNPLYWIGVQLDITEQKLAQDELRSSEARFRSVVESMGEGLLITDADDVVTYANPRMMELTGYTEEEMLGRPAYELLLPPERWPEMVERNRERMAGLDERYEIQLKRKDGSSFWAEINATPYRDATGEIVGTLGAITDITARKRTERALRESEQRFRQLFEQSVDALFVHDEKGRFVDCNSRACQLLGYTREELLDLRVEDVSCGMLTEEERLLREQEGGTLWQRALAGEPGVFAFSHEEENRRKDGTTFPVEVRVGSVDYGGRRMILVSTRDITERKRAEAALKESAQRHRRQAQELSLLYEVSAAVAQELDLSVVFRTVVEALAHSFGYALVCAYRLEDEVLVLQHQVGYERVAERIPISEGISGRVARTGRPVLLEDVREDPTFTAAVEGVTSQICVPLTDRGRVAGVLNVESTGVALAQADLRLVNALAEQVGGAIGRARLYTQVRESEERLAYRAFHDSLTGLANRALFLNRLEHAQARAKRQKGKLALLFMDLDNFKIINDSLGHDIGDRLLVTVAERLRTCVRPQDTVARLGGDEFVALLEDLTDAGHAVRVAERIMEELREPFEINGHRLHTSASIGIALGTTSGGDLLRAADTAMYRAKESGKGRYEVFKEAMHGLALERLRLENDLRLALEREEFTLQYQPKVDLRTGRMVGVEALLRWGHPEYGLLYPRDFMPLAEQTELVIPIGRWVLLETCRHVKGWQERCASDASPLLGCVNLSVTQLRQTDFTLEVLGETGLDPGSLLLEISEYAVMEDAQAAIGALEKLKGSGIKLAIDDFGTGYSSLSYLRRLPVDYLKIDRSFIEKLGEDSKDSEIVSGTIALAHTLGLGAIAEGVETATQLERLREMGCDMAQGNYFAEPLDATAVTEYLQRDWVFPP